MNLLEDFKAFLLSSKDQPSKVTVKNYLSDINHFVRWYESYYQKAFAPQLVTPGTLEAYRRESITEVNQQPMANGQQPKLSPSSLERHLSSLRKFFQFLKLNGQIGKSPFEIASSQSSTPEADPYRLRDFKNFLYVYNASHLTIKNYIIDIKQFFSWIEQVFEAESPSSAYKLNTNNYLLSKISPSLLEEYKQRLIKQGGFSAATVNRKLSSLRKYLTWAASEDIISQQPTISNFQFSISNQAGNLSIEQFKENINRGIKESRGQNQETPTSNFNYSRIAPVRLGQKISKSIMYAFDELVSFPFAKAANSVSYVLWIIKGRPIFTTVKTQGSEVKPKKVQPKSFLEIHNFKKELYAPLDISTKYFPWYKKAWYNLRYKRPKWYETYHSYAIVHYFHYSILIIFMAVIGFGFYQNLFQAPARQSPLFAAGIPQAPLRILSFQGRLTDNSDNPISTPSALRFAIYDKQAPASASSDLLWQEVDVVQPDQDGIFSVLLGNAGMCPVGQTNPTGPCGIPNWLFASNSALFLGVTVNTTPELTPRQQLATVAYAANSETLQGLPPITNSTNTSNVVLALDSNGNLSIGGSANPTFQATGGQFAVSGQPLLLTTNAGSNANVNITPDGLGQIALNKPLVNTSNNNNISTAKGAVEIDGLAAILATSSGQSALTINQNGSGPIVSASASGNARFTVDNSGNVNISGVYRVNGTQGLTLTNACVNTTGGIVTGTGTCPATAPAYDLYWNQTSGTNGGILFPNNSGVDFLVGGQSSASATFEILNNSLSRGNQVASVSGSLTLDSSAASIQTTKNQGLTIGGSKTGNITLAPTNSVAGSNVVPGANNVTDLGISSLNWRNIYANTYNSGSSAGQTYTNASCVNTVGGIVTGTGSCPGFGVDWWNQTGGLIYPVGNLYDFAIGGNSTSSALFSYTGIQSGHTIASVSGQLIVMPNNGYGGQIGINTTSPAPGVTLDVNGLTSINNQLNIRGTWAQIQSDTNANLELKAQGTGSLIFTPGGVQQGVFTSTGQFGIGTVPTATLDVNGAASVGGQLTFRSGTAQIQSTVNQLLTLGGNTTGNIILSPNNGTVGAAIYPSANNAVDLGSSSYQFRNIYATTYKTGSSTGQTLTNASCINTVGGIVTGSGTCSSTAGVNWWNELGGSLSPVNTTDDFLLGSTATSSALFSFTGIETGHTVASVSGNLVVMPNNGWGGLLGIGTTTPTAALTVVANSPVSTTSEKSSSMLDITTGTGGQSLYLSYDGNNNYGFIESTKTGSYVPLLLQPRGGQVGINLTTTPSYQLDVNGTVRSQQALHLGPGSGEYIQVLSGNNYDMQFFTASSERMRIQNSTGNVGIGTTLPAYPLDVNGIVNAGGFNGNGAGKNFTSFVANNPNNGYTAFASYTGSDTTPNVQIPGWSGIQFGPGGSSPLDSGITRVGSVSNTLRIDGGGSGTGNLWINGTTIVDSLGVNNGTTSNFLQFGGNSSGEGIGSKRTSGGNQNGLDLYTNNENRLAITNTGLVGIGTTAPTANLQVTGGYGSNDLLTLNQLNSGNIFSASASGLTQAYLKNDGSFYASSFYDINNPTYFLDPAATATAGAIFGSVGVGTNTPAYKLDVQGGSINTSDNFVKGGGTRAPSTDNNTYTTTSTSYIAVKTWTISVTGDRIVKRVNLQAAVAGSYYSGASITNIALSTSSNCVQRFQDTSSANTYITSYINLDVGSASPTELGHLGYNGNITLYTCISAGQTSATAYVNNETLEVVYANGVNEILNLPDVDLSTAGSGLGADYAENYASSQNLQPGEIVSADPSSPSLPSAVMATTSYDKSIVGIVSTNPGMVIGTDSVPNGYPIALMGRVPTNVSTINGPIKVGDPITSSQIPGVGMKATEPGQIVGKALESFDSSKCTESVSLSATNSANFGIVPSVQSACEGTILVYVNPGFYDPTPAIITAAGGIGNFVINSATGSAFVVADNLGNTIDNTGVFASAVIGNLRVGALNASNVLADAVTTNILNANQIVSPIAQIDTVHTNLISPIASGSAIALKLENNKLSIVNSNSASGSAVASIDNQGNATFSGQLSATSGQFGDATISGTLHAGKILASEIEGLPTATSSSTIVNNYYYNSTPSASPAVSSANQALSMATPSGSLNTNYLMPDTNFIDVSTMSGLLANVGNLNAQTATFTQGLMALGPSSFSDISVVGQFSVGGSLTLASNSINVLGSDLQLQPLRQGGLSVMAGLFYIDTNGNVNVGGDAMFAKNVTVKGKLSTNIISPIPGNDLSINLASDSANPIYNSKFRIQNASGAGVLSLDQNGDLMASGTATFGKLNLNFIQPAMALSSTEVVATGSAGTAQINAYQTQVTVDDPLVTANSLIYITPVGTNQNIYLLKQVPNDTVNGVKGSFTVGASGFAPGDIKFNFLIIN